MRRKNVVNTMVAVFAVACVVTLTWFGLGYSLAFTAESPWLGNLGRAWFASLHFDGRRSVISVSHLAPHLPEAAYALFQAAFAIITTSLIVGAVVERMRFAALVVFAALWSVVVYAPVAHWVWESGGWLNQAGRTGLCRRCRGACERGCGCVGLCLHDGAQAWLWHRALRAAQPGLDGHGHGVAAVRLVRLQRRIGPVRRRACSAGLCGHAGGGLGRGAGMDGGGVAGARRSDLAGPALGHGGRTGGHHPGCWLCAGGQCSVDRPDCGRCLLLGGNLAQAPTGADDSLDVFGVHGVGGIAGSILTAVLPIL